MWLMGVDIGTTGVKAAVFDPEGKMLAYSFHEYDVICEKSGYAEQDAELVWKYVREVMSSTASKVNGEITAISISTQGDAVIPMDKQCNALCYAQLGMDYRAVKETAEISKLIGERTLFTQTGIRPHPLNSLVKMMWFERNLPNLKKKLWKYATYSDFILAKMGSDEPVIDLTMASRTMCLDIKTNQWSKDILSAAGIDVSLLSKPVPSGTLVGHLRTDLCNELGIKLGAMLVAGGHDQTCAALGAGLIRENVALDSHGTAEVLSTAFNKPRLDDVMFNSYYPCYRHVVPNMYFTFALNHVGGILLKWYKDNLGYAEVVEAEKTGERAFEKIVVMAPCGPSPLLVLPHFNGSGTPTCDINSKGAILGLTMSSTRHDIAKGILDSTAFELRINIETMRKAGINIQQLLCVGGGARSPIDLKLKADVTGIPLSTLRVREAACLGAAILAGMGAGVYDNVNDAISCVKTDITYYPDDKMYERYNEKYAVYTSLYEALKETNSKIKSW